MEIDANGFDAAIRKAEFINANVAQTEIYQIIGAYEAAKSADQPVGLSHKAGNSGGMKTLNMSKYTLHNQTMINQMQNNLRYPHDRINGYVHLIDKNGFAFVTDFKRFSQNSDEGDAMKYAGAFLILANRMNQPSDEVKK